MNERSRTPRNAEDALLNLFHPVVDPPAIQGTSGEHEAHYQNLSVQIMPRHGPPAPFGQGEIDQLSVATPDRGDSSSSAVGGMVAWCLAVRWQIQPADQADEYH